MTKSNLARGCLLAAVVTLATGFGVGQEQDTPTTEAQVSEVAGAVEFPQRREGDGIILLLHAPQIRSWPAFERFEAMVAVEVSSTGDATLRYGTAVISGETEIDLGARLVRVSSPKVDDVQFLESVPDAYRNAVLAAASRSELDVPLDLFLAHLADHVLSNPPPAGFNSDPPEIAVRSAPTLLLSINGEPVMETVPGTALQRVINANWPLFKSTDPNKAYFLLDRDGWLTSTRLDSGWEAASKLPAEFAKLPDEPPYKAARSAYPMPARPGPAPEVLSVRAPTELIVTVGKPKTEAIYNAGALAFVSNTESPLFRLNGQWYYLVAGRWFSTAQLEQGPWTYVTELPDAFSKIPVDHPRAAVRASVSGTVEARMAALEALLPTTVAAATGAAPPVKVSYAGDPKFEPVADAGVSRAVNTGLDVIQYEDTYYLLYAGIWYDSPAPIGPWRVTSAVPAAIYEIPPSSPSYHVTQVQVVESTPTEVVYSYPPSYSSSVYVAYGVPYYGTGWYYPPYIWGAYYYPYPIAYGHGSWYNPATGGYGSRSAWYGPYGGYSYNQGYNPTTGRYGYMETAWDGDEWASYGETYNSRTGVGTETSRYYDEDNNRSEMERTTQRGDQMVNTEREIKFDSNTVQTERETSGGASSETVRQASDGVVSSSGTISTGDGRSYSVDGSTTRDGGSTTITGAEGSASIDTKRQDGRSVSSIEGSGGGQGISISGQGAGRTTIGQSGSGDLYAGHDGNVYKKTEDGWQNYKGGDWQPVDVPDPSRERPSSTSQRPAAPSPSTSREMSAYGGQRTQQPDYNNLNRDYGARQQGSRQFQQRSAGMARGGRGARRR